MEQRYTETVSKLHLHILHLEWSHLSLNTILGSSWGRCQEEMSWFISLETTISITKQKSVKKNLAGDVKSKYGGNQACESKCQFLSFISNFVIRCLIADVALISSMLLWTQYIHLERSCTIKISGKKLIILRSNKENDFLKLLQDLRRKMIFLNQVYTYFLIKSAQYIRKCFIWIQSQTCSNNHLFKTTTCIRQPVLSPPKQIPIQSFLHLSNVTSNHFFCLPNEKKPV